MESGRILTPGHIVSFTVKENHDGSALPISKYFSAAQLKQNIRHAAATKAEKAARMPHPAQYTILNKNKKSHEAKLISALNARFLQESSLQILRKWKNILEYRTNLALLLTLVQLVVNKIGRCGNN